MNIIKKIKNKFTAMIDLFSFFHSKTPTLLGDKTSEISAWASSALKSMPELPNILKAMSFTKENIAEKSTKEVISYIQEDEFMKSISKDIGIPQEQETKEDFVARCMEIAKKKLYAKFGL